MDVVPRTCPTRSTHPVKWLRRVKSSVVSVSFLPEEKRSILEMKAEGLSSKDIGERLGISERTVQRVLEDLRRRMETEWESP